MSRRGLEIPMDDHAGVAHIHAELVNGLRSSGKCPTNGELANRLRESESVIVARLQALADIHGVVLHPHKPEPWIVHPFSTTPTLNVVEKDSIIWWVPCMWCAFGVASLAGGEVTIHSRFGAERQPVSISVVDGEPVGNEDVVVHFAIPPARAWDNVHQHCSLLLPFRTASEVRPWCVRHGTPYGETVPLRRVSALARLWYRHHADPDWHKWTITEAQSIFDQVGLRSEFWDLGAKVGRF